eukprot:m.346772 g.346772  ORF g.346772 m.346772 type:complete len:62 (+) comp30325_c0_seq1:38-223(+)
MVNAISVTRYNNEISITNANTPPTHVSKVIKLFMNVGVFFVTFGIFLHKLYVTLQPREATS